MACEERPIMETPIPVQSMPSGQLLARRRTAVRFQPDAAARAAIARLLGLIDLPELTFEAEVTPEGRGDLRLVGRLRGRAVQACIVTLAPVPAKVDEAIERRFTADWQDPTGDEAEVPEDDTVEPLPVSIDFAAIAIEALALALPDYPRAPGAGLGVMEFPATPDAGAPEADRKPLAGLAALLGRKPEAE
jgi:uncharacterized metal-binding protein YceD (DUF177 family)